MIRTIYLLIPLLVAGCAEDSSYLEKRESPRERIPINHDWRFTKGDPPGTPVNLAYDVRPDVTDHRDDRDADTHPTEAVDVEASPQVLKPWSI